MKFFTFNYLILITLLISGFNSNAQLAGFNTSYAVLSINGGANTYYDLQASTGNLDFDGINFGSFTSSNTLVLKGAEHNVYKCGGCDLTSTRLYYRVYLTGSTPGAFSNLNIGYSSGGSNGCGGEDQQWANTSYSTNILSGLPAGNYTFELYSDATVTCEGGTVYAGNLGANYKATFRFCGSPTGALTPGNYSIPGCFPTIASAASYLNTNGVTGAGTVQFDVAAGHIETAPSTGILISGIGTAGNLASGTITTPIVFKKSGVGANPKVIAAAWTAGTNTNGIIKLIGSDFITFDGFTLEENPSNIIVTTGASNTMTELGFGLFLGSASNGAQNNTIKNCTISLNSNYPNSIGILSTSSSSFTDGSLSATSSAGTNSFNTYVSNTITNVAYGIYMICQPNTATVTETGNVVGGAIPELGNSITFGNSIISNAVWSRFSGLPTAGIVYRNGASVSIENNTITSNSLAYTQNFCGGIIITSAGTGGAVPAITYAASINNNTISIVNNGISSSVGIDFGYGLLTTNHTSKNNTISLECGAAVSHSAINYGIRSQYASLTNEISGNTISINQSGTGPFTAAVFFINANGRKTNLTIQNNTLQSTGSHIKTSNIIYGISHGGGATGNVLIGGSLATKNTINISRGAVPGTNFVYGIFGTDPTSVPTSFNVSFNSITLSNINGTSLPMGIYNFEGNNSIVKAFNNNTITISGTTTGVSDGMFLSNGIITASNNVINVSSGAVSVAGIDFTLNGSVNQAYVDNNSITLTSSAVSPIVRGISTSLINVSNGFSITNNTIESISATATTGNPTLFGIKTSLGTNNIIAGNTIKNISTVVGSGDALLFGIDLTGTTVNPSVFNNKIYNIQNLFSGTNSNVSGISILAGSSTFYLYNNIISDLKSSASSVNAVNGISCGASNSTYKIYYNTIKLGSSSPLIGATNFGVKGIGVIDNSVSTVLDLRNNIINLNVIPSGAGYASCVAFASGTSGVVPPGFAATSNNNIYHINSNVNNYLFAQGTDSSTIVNGFAISGLNQSLTNNIINDTNFNATCGYYKTFMGGTLDAATYSEDNLVAGSSVGTFSPSGNSFAENGALLISSPSITTDLDGILRTPTNDRGALQFSGVSMTYTNPSNVASVLISASPSGPIATSTTVTFTATPTNEGAFPTYQWSINNVPVPGETGTTFTSSTLIENDSVTLEMTSDDNCVAIPLVISNPIVIDVVNPYDTNVVNTQCGSTLSAINQQIFANYIFGAESYRFKVTDLVTNQVQTIDKLLRVFQLTQLPTYAFDRTYKIEVAVRILGVWQPYGNACNVTTPIPTTSLVNCNATLSLMTDAIYATNVPYSIGYRFKVTNTTTLAEEIIDRPIRDFRITYLTAPQYNTTYSVQVAVRNTNGNYLPYGASCFVTTPAIPKSQLVVSQCNSTLPINTIVFADNFVGATTYRYKFENISLGYSYVFDRPLPTFNLNQVTGLLSGQTYSVTISIEVGTVFGPYGNECTITIPGALREMAPKTDSFDAKAIPNPFSDNFYLTLTSSSNDIVQVKIYDMLGKIIDESSIDVLSISDLEIGKNLASGIYNVIVIQGEETKSIRVIKR